MAAPDKSTPASNPLSPPEPGDAGIPEDLESQLAAIADENPAADDADDLDTGLRDPLYGGSAELLDNLADEVEEQMPVRKAQFQQLRPSDEISSSDSIDRLLDVGLCLSVELGRKEMQIKEILALGPGKIIELDKLSGEPVDLLVNGKLLARGEVVVVDENFGVRITELITPTDRIRMV
jgi:flagellar motor switch protein FliN